jgi:hypothetical protein
MNDFKKHGDKYIKMSKVFESHFKDKNELTLDNKNGNVIINMMNDAGEVFRELGEIHLNLFQLEEERDEYKKRCEKLVIELEKCKI